MFTALLERAVFHFEDPRDKIEGCQRERRVIEEKFHLI